MVETNIYVGIRGFMVRRLTFLSKTDPPDPWYLRLLNSDMFRQVAYMLPHVRMLFAISPPGPIISQYEGGTLKLAYT